ncbi:MAG: ATP-binding protein [Candidatus Binatota bacterium]
MTCRVEPGLPLIAADPRRLDQVFANLLSNAIKFTGEGGEIEVGARAPLSS